MPPFPKLPPQRRILRTACGTATVDSVIFISLLARSPLSFASFCACRNLKEVHKAVPGLVHCDSVSSCDVF